MRSAVAGDRAGCSRRARWLAWLAAATTFWLLALAIPASAHAVFVSASPAPGASLTRAPALLRIVFSEPLVPALSGVELEASSGKPVQPRSAQVDPRDHSAYELGLPRLRPDRYTVIWRTTSQVDGHFRAGTYTFTVLEPGGAAPPGGSAAAAPPSAPPSAPAQLPTSLQAATSLAELAGLFLVVGTALMLLLGGLARPAAARLFGWLLAAAGAATLVGVLGQFAATWAPTGWQASALPSVLGSDVAKWLWLRLGAVAAVLLAWPWPAGSDRPSGRTGPARRSALRPARRLVRRFVPAAAGLAMVVSFGATAHPAASAYPVAGLAFITVHILAASVWVGGVLGLAIVWGLARRAGANPDERRVLLRRFSLVAGMAVPAVAATGAASALLELGSTADFVRSGYGITLLAKLAVAAAVGVAAVSNVLVHRRGPVTAPERAGRVRTGLWAEAGLGLLVLVPAVIMSVLGPPGPADAARSIGQQLAAASDPANAFTADSTLGHGGLELSLTPGTAGTNAVRIEVDGANAAAQLRVGLTRTGGGPVLATVRRAGYDHDPQTHTVYQGSITLPAAGAWTAVVRGPAVTSPAITVPLRATLAGVQAGQAAAPRLDAWLLAIAVLGAAGVAAGAARCGRGRRWRGASFAFGGAGGIAALAGIAVLSLAAQSSASAAVSSPWGTASRVTGTTGNGATTWPVGGQGAGLMMPAVGPDGSVWVGEMDANALARLGPDRDVVQQFPLPGGYKEVMGVAVDGDNHVWIAEEHAQALGMFDPATGRYRQYRVPGDDPAPVGVAVDASGQVWFTMMNGNAIGRLDPGTARVTEYPVPASHALPYWLAVGPHGQVWFTEFGAGKLGVLSPATGKIGEYPLPDGGSPVGIAIGASGTVWATATQGLVVRVDARTGAMRVFHAPQPDEYGAAVGGDGTVWVGLASGAVVYSFAPATAAFTEHKLPAGSDPWWVAAGPAHVWVALSSGAQGGLGELDAVS
ncbi:MAG TPA: copper resistance protein CopC [Trebonia sp.]